MEKEALENAIKHAVTVCADDSGWANLAEIGAFLRKDGIKYGKLSHFLGSYKHLVETRIDNTVMPPVIYAKLL